MQRELSFIMTTEELFGDKPKQIAIFMEGLTENEKINAFRFLNELQEQGRIKSFDTFVSKYNMNIGYILHSNINDYNCETETSNSILEMLRLLLVDEVWVFDIGYGNYELDGRLDKIIKKHMLPVRFLERTLDNTSWGFYKGRDIVLDNTTKEVIEDFYMIGLVEPYNKDIISKGNIGFKRKFSKDTMTKMEFEITERAFNLTYVADSLRMLAEVRLDMELCETACKYIGDCNRVFFGMLNNENLTDTILKNYENQLDFLEKDLEKYL